MTFSIIIPLFNKESTIAEAIRSVLQQTRQDFEIIVVNDGSSDNSLSAAESVTDVRISIYTTANHGPGAARNFGIRKANGIWIVFLDADDKLLPEALDSFSSAIREEPSSDIIYGTTVFNRQGNLSRFPRQSERGCVKNPFKEAFFRRLSIAAGSACIRKEALIKEPFNESFRRTEDVDLHRRLWKICRCFRITEPTIWVNSEFAESSKPRINPAEDFISHISLKHAGFWERMYLYELYLGAKNTYGLTGDELSHNYDRRYLLLLLNRLLLKKW